MVSIYHKINNSGKLLDRKSLSEILAVSGVCGSGGLTYLLAEFVLLIRSKVIP